ncbi:GNAT family N-acetyltransferase [Lysinibacillus endophyticus]|uniref:N-acetyltransferase n=1 Tax=Ureibacillus endophyticus TaxID=1978490 RepID=A0A494YXL8_9BACL|nr:GNAT family N-acetyltransferase [Lysinibacillus endophyticus]MCP1143205.1 GNAT family N-acetyltransferase [Lysinibacillus endophyticus]RKQ14971.1 N-acetyltransferase [Lysinibacillus endophyticus]
MKVTFVQINILGEIIYEDDYVKHYHFQEMLTRYDSNYIEFKKMPSVEEFQQWEKSLREFHRKNNQNHLKFKFPPNEQIPDTLKYYLKRVQYNIGFLELYSIQPSQFSIRKNGSVNVQFVTEEQLEPFLKLQYNEDVKYGVNFAKEKQQLQLRRFNDADTYFLIAYFEGIPAGYVEVIEKESTVEIDNLFVLEEQRHKGIGGHLQQAVMEKFPNKTVILVADGEDTPKDMYQKQGYEYQGFQFEVSKVEIF